MTSPMAIDYFTTGGGTDMVLAFNYLAAFANSSLMASLARIAIVIGVIWMAGKVAFGGEIRDVLKWFIVSMVVWMGFVETKTTVIVNDSANPFLVNRVIDNVPWAVGFFGGQVSEAGRIVADQVTAFSSLPDSVTYQRNGFLFGANLLSQATRFRVVNDKLAATMTNFFDQCVLYGTLLQHTDFEVVANSDNMAAVIPAELSSAMTFVSITESGGTVSTQTEECAAGFSNVLDRVEDDIDRVLLREAVGRYPAAEFTDAERIARYTDDLESFQNVMIGSAVSARDRIRQGMFISALDESVSRFLASSGNSAAMQHYQAAKAEAQSFASKNTAGLLAAKFVPLAKIVFEVLYITFFPIAAVLMMTPYWPAVIKGYFGGFVWLASWEAVSVPLHNMAIGSYAKAYAGAAAYVSPEGVRSNIISYANHLGVRAVEQDIASTAGYFMVFAPVLAGGLLFGAGKLASVATSSISATQGAANETAREATTGSVGLNNVSMDTIRNNKMDTSSSIDNGRLSGYLASGAAYTQNADGSMSFAAGSALTTGGVDLKYNQDLGARASESMERSVTTASEAINSYSTGLSTATRQISDLMNSTGVQNSVAAGASTGNTTRSSDGVSQAWNNIREWSNTQGVDAQTGLRAVLAATAGGEVAAGLGKSIAGLGVSASGRLDLSTTGSVAASEGFSNLVKAAQSDGITKDMQTVLDYAQTQSTSQTSTTGNSSTSGISSSLDEVTSSLSTASNSLREANTHAQRAEIFRTEGLALSANGTSAFARHLDASWSHMPKAERIERIADTIMNKGWLNDPQAMQELTTFLAGAAQKEGLAAGAMANALVLPGWGGTGSGGSGGSSNGSSGIQNSWPAEAGRGQTGVMDHWRADTGLIETRAFGDPTTGSGGVLPSGDEIEAQRAGLTDRIETQAQNTRNHMGYREAVTSGRNAEEQARIGDRAQRGAASHAAEVMGDNVEDFADWITGKDQKR